MRHLLPVNVLLALTFFVSSCGKQEIYTQIEPSATELSFDAEGGEREVTFPNGDWCIKGIFDKDASTNQFGLLYDESGKLVGSNQPLQLNGLGGLASQWEDCGYIVTRSRPNALTVAMKENYTDRALTYYIRLQSGEVYKDIALNQPATHGYKFKKIEFKLLQGDGDSLYQRRMTGYNVTVPEPREWIYYPLYNAPKESFFENEKPNLFNWTREDSVKIRLPVGIEGTHVLIGSEEGVLDNGFTKHPSGFERTEHVEQLPAGTTKAEFFAQYRRRSVSYTVTLSNRKTGSELSYNGRWTEHCPTGKIEVTITRPEQTEQN